MKKLLTVIGFQVVYLIAVAAQGTGNSYATTFPNTENPLSEGGRWINGQSVGLDWKDVRTRPGLAYGADASGTPTYDDPTAILTGNWGPDQTVQGTVYSVNQQTGQINEEVELRLRSTITPHVNTGYEVLFRCTHDGSQYHEIVRWNGPKGSFTYLNRTSGPGIRNGDVVKATIIGNRITSYINNVKIMEAVDSTYTSGNPGIGFYLNRAPNLNADYGFTTFSASDTGSLPDAPTNVRIVSTLLSPPHSLFASPSAIVALFFPSLAAQAGS